MSEITTIQTNGNNKKHYNYEVVIKEFSDGNIFSWINLIKNNQTIQPPVVSFRQQLDYNVFGIPEPTKWKITSNYIAKEDEDSIYTYQRAIDYIDNLIDNDIIK